MNGVKHTSESGATAIRNKIIANQIQEQTNNLSNLGKYHFSRHDPNAPGWGNWIAKLITPTTPTELALSPLLIEGKILGEVTKPVWKFIKRSKYSKALAEKLTPFRTKVAKHTTAQIKRKTNYYNLLKESSISLTSSQKSILKSEKGIIKSFTKPLKEGGDVTLYRWAPGPTGPNTGLPTPYSFEKGFYTINPLGPQIYKHLRRGRGGQKGFKVWKAEVPASKLKQYYANTSKEVTSWAEHDFNTRKVINPSGARTKYQEFILPHKVSRTATGVSYKQYSKDLINKGFNF